MSRLLLALSLCLLCLAPAKQDPVTPMVRLAQVPLSAVVPIETARYTCHDFTFDYVINQGVVDYAYLLGTNSGVYYFTNHIGNTNVFCVTNLFDGITYYVAAIAINDVGMESYPSAEIMWPWIRTNFVTLQEQWSAAWTNGSRYTITNPPATAFFRIKSDLTNKVIQTTTRLNNTATVWSVMPSTTGPAPTPLSRLQINAYNNIDLHVVYE